MSHGDDDMAREVQMHQILDTLALLAERLVRLNDLVERIAVGLGVDPNAPVSRR